MLFSLFAPLVLAIQAVTAAGVTPVLSGGAVTFGPGTYPRATRLSNGNLLGAYTTVINGTNFLRTVLSTNNGQSWSAQGEITSGVGDIDNPFLIQLANGKYLGSLSSPTIAFSPCDLQGAWWLPSGTTRGTATPTRSSVSR